MLVPLYSMTGEAVGELELRDDVFGIKPNESVMHQAVIRQQANARLGTHKVKTRGEVSGGGRKPWKQKGTGRARQGSSRSPQWKGGGVVFGPVVRTYTQKMNRKMRRLALKSALSTKAADQQIKFVESLVIDSFKTSAMAELLKRLSIDSNVLIILPAANEMVERSAANLPFVKTIQATCLSVRDLLLFDYIILPSDAVDVIYKTYGVEALS